MIPKSIFKLLTKYLSSCFQNVVYVKFLEPILKFQNYLLVRDRRFFQLKDV